MKQRYVTTPLLFFVFLFQISRSQTTTPAATTSANNWQALATQYLETKAYAFERLKDGYTAYNPKGRFLTTATATGYTITKPGKAGGIDWSVKMALTQIGPFPVTTAAFDVQYATNHLLFTTASATVEYINTEAGTRQNFIVHQRPDGSGSLQVRLHITTPLKVHQLSRTGIAFYQSGKKGFELAYDGLTVWDAQHKPLAASMQWQEAKNELLITVNDQDAAYPVTIDPLNRTPAWTTSADGVLPGLLSNLQVDAAYGYTVAGVGDVNGDGIDDIAVGAPGTVNIVSSTSVLQSGAVFVYFGTAAGFPTAPSRELRATTPVANALFGYSIAGGNIAGDSRNEIIVGAPLDQYQTVAAGLFSDPTVTVTAGKVYIFRGEDLSTGTTPFLEVRLQGTSFFSEGIAGLLQSNIANKDLFGFSVATTEDVTGDGRGELLVGVPGYTGVALLAARSGAAFVYYSNDLSTTTPLQLQTPTPTLLGLVTLPVANTNSLLFGYSVDGLGDFNGDNIPDLVVGAPAGADLNTLGGIFSGQVLGGSAHVYYGTASGFTATPSTRLQASASGLLSSVANLFGFSVRGVRTAAGNRSGSVLVGAPAGNVVSNVTNGLRLKTGSVSVFVKRSAPGSPLTANQTLTSPRGNSLLTLLTGQNLSVSALFGAAIDNTLDVNCDNINDIVVGEPLSTGVGLVNADVAGGAAFVFTGLSDGTYTPTPQFTVTTEVNPDLGVNAASLLGYSVAGSRRSSATTGTPPVLVGAPARSLDFGTGLLNLGTTFGTLFSFTSGSNGLGKAYAFTAPVCGVALPVTLLEFKGEKTSAGTQLSWTTVEASNLLHYRVEHSTDGKTFQPIGYVLAENNTGETHYRFLHKEPATGMNYYRLQIVERDNNNRYSAIAVIRWGTTGQQLVIAPNPAQGVIRVQLNSFTAGTYRIAIINTAGQVQQQHRIRLNGGTELQTFARQNLTPGMYTLNLYSSAGDRLQSVLLILQ